MSAIVAQSAEARHHRGLLSGVTFVAVTGSCGKTTTKNLIAHVLGSRFRGSKSLGSDNCGADLERDLLATSPDAHFHVQELGAWGPGTLDAGIDLLRPDIAVITNLRNDHYSAFHGPRGAQAEKGKLVASLPATGTAVLNWDDPLVRELGARTHARLVSFGRVDSAQVRATDVTSNWPSPLSFRASHRGRRVQVRTQLHGEHLLGSALAAISVALVFGMPLDGAASALETAQPTQRRMTPVHGPDGVTFIRDDFKAPADSLAEVLAFMRAATANRKIAVLGRISDFPGRSRRVYTAVAQQALATVDTVVFVGSRAVQLWGEQTSGSAAALAGSGPTAQLYVFGSAAPAREFLDDYLRAGDLVLLKGSGPVDHLERIMLSRYRPVRCWLPDCGRTTSCDLCELLTTTS